MQIKLNELRAVIREELTAHNAGRLKSVIQSALRVSQDFVENVKIGNRDADTTISDILHVAKEVTAMANWLKGRNEPEAKPALEIAALLNEIGKSTDPFKRLFGAKDREFKRIEPLMQKIHKIAQDSFKMVRYDEKYQNFDDDNKQQTYSH